MTAPTLQTKQPKTSSNASNGFEKWIQAPLAQYRSAYVGSEWQLSLGRTTTSTSATQVTGNEIPVSLLALFQAIETEAENNQLLAGWLAVAEDSFDFWDNDLDAAYDDL